MSKWFKVNAVNHWINRDLISEVILSQGSKGWWVTYRGTGPSSDQPEAAINYDTEAEARAELERFLDDAPKTGLTFDQAIDIAHGCRDYGGGYHNKNERDIFQHGIETVGRSLEAAKKTGLSDLQSKTLQRMGQVLRNMQPSEIEVTK